MTAVDLAALAKLREELAAALADSRPWNEPWADLPEKLREQFRITADALLPVVDRIANERAAAELEAAADRAEGTFCRCAGPMLRARADALDPS